MKRLVLLLLLCMFSSTVVAQKIYSVNGNDIELKTEVSGTITLLWNIIEGKYRYFAKKGDAIAELTNTKGSNNKYQEEYKTILEGITLEVDLTAEKVKLTLPSLRNFIYDYNSKVDPNYSEDDKQADLQANLLLYGGITNHPFIVNPDNIKNPVFGLEVEVFEANQLPRHSLFFQAKHALSSDEFNYSSTQLGIGYRFRFFKQEGFNLYGNIIIATYNFNNTEVVVQNVIVNESTNGLDAPLIFGVGADIRISDRSYITIAYDELFAILLENQDQFSTHLTIGYKLNL